MVGSEFENSIDLFASNETFYILNFKNQILVPCWPSEPLAQDLVVSKTI
jgi:hypothetical protein